jgi:hypothetical protein
MRRLFGWMAGLASVAALAKLYHRRRHEPPPADAADHEPHPAEELRRKLDEVRATEPADDAAEPTADDSAEASSTTIEERRAAVHARAQEAIDAMKSDGA